MSTQKIGNKIEEELKEKLRNDLKFLDSVDFDEFDMDKEYFKNGYTNGFVKGLEFAKRYVSPKIFDKNIILLLSIMGILTIINIIIAAS